MDEKKEKNLLMGIKLIENYTRHDLDVSYDNFISTQVKYINILCEASQEQLTALCHINDSRIQLEFLKSLDSNLKQNVYESKLYNEELKSINSGKPWTLNMSNNLKTEFDREEYDINGGHEYKNNPEIIRLSNMFGRSCLAIVCQLIKMKLIDDFIELANKKRKH
jgi:hypothetical protein